MGLEANVVLPDFSPPGNLPDMNAETRKIWSKDFISYWMTGEITADPNVVVKGRTPLTQFFNGTLTPYDVTQSPTPVTWNAFPKLVKDKYAGNQLLAWQIADASRMVQDEYLEWSVQRDTKDTDKIKSVVYTCEGPEYWQVLASYQKDDFLKIVKEMNPSTKEDMSDNDFFLIDPKNKWEIYNPANYWNLRSTTGSIIHLLQPNNTLSAEIDIAAQGTVIRKDKSGQVITNPDQLINCSKYGNAGRNSDPQIGSAINSQARTGKILSVADPVALYIHKLEESVFQLDYGTTDDDDPESQDLKPVPEGVFVFQRGNIKKSQGLRFRVSIPDGLMDNNGKQMTVTNLYDKTTSMHVRYGAQIADHVTMGVSAVIIEGQTPAEPIPCFGEPKTALPLPQLPPTTQEAKTEKANGAEAPKPHFDALVARKSAVETSSHDKFPFPKSVGRKYYA